MASARQKPVQHERKLQIEAVNAIRTLYPHTLCYAIPNGGSRNVREAANLKRMGVLAGVPDLAIHWLGGYGVIELKIGKGKLTPPQFAVMAKLKWLGVNVAVCKSLDEVLATIKGWGVR